MEAVQILEGQPRLEQSDEARDGVILADARPRRLRRTERASKRTRLDTEAWNQGRGDGKTQPKQKV